VELYDLLIAVVGAKLAPCVGGTGGENLAVVSAGAWDNVKTNGTWGGIQDRQEGRFQCGRHEKDSK